MPSVDSGGGVLCVCIVENLLTLMEVPRERKRVGDPTRGSKELGPGVSIMASSSAPRRDRASVAFELLRLKSCPQGQLDYPCYPFPSPLRQRVSDVPGSVPRLTAAGEMAPW